MTLVLLIAAFILFVLAAIGLPNTSRFNLVAAGLACWVAAAFVGNL